jgi:dTMP kinase
MRGRFIVVEGVDGSGKSTMAERLALHLGRDRKVLTYREPGGTPLGVKIRELLLDAKNSEMVPMTELFLFMASRAQLVEENIRPALRRGSVVVCDRYYYSTAAYQGAAGRIGIQTVIDLAEKIGRFERPDLVLLFDVDPAIARRREGNRTDRVENKGLEYQRKVRAGFLQLARKDPRRIKVIDSSRPPDDVFEAVKKAVDRVL